MGPNTNAVHGRNIASCVAHHVDHTRKALVLQSPPDTAPLAREDAMSPTNQRINDCYANITDNGTIGWVRAKLPVRRADFWPHFTQEEGLAKGLQNILTGAAEATTFGRLFNAHDRRGRARLRSSKNQPGRSSAFFTTVPTAKMLVARDDVFGGAVRLRLGLFPMDDIPNANCPCGLPPSPDHWLICRLTRNSSGLQRHNNCQRTFSGMVRQAGGSSYLEPPNLDNEGRRLRPDSINFIGNDTDLTDTSITCPTANSYVDGAARSDRYAAHTRETVKHTLYDRMATDEHATMHALVLETYGAQGVETRVFVKKMALLASQLPEAFMSQAEYSAFFTNMIAVQLQKGNWLMQRQGAAKLRAHAYRGRANLPPL